MKKIYLEYFITLKCFSLFNTTPLLFQYTNYYYDCYFIFQIILLKRKKNFKENAVITYQKLIDKWLLNVWGTY